MAEKTAIGQAQRLLQLLWAQALPSSSFACEMACGEDMVNPQPHVPLQAHRPCASRGATLFNRSAIEDLCVR